MELSRPCDAGCLQSSFAAATCGAWRFLTTAVDEQCPCPSFVGLMGQCSGMFLDGWIAVLYAQREEAP